MKIVGEGVPHQPLLRRFKWSSRKKVHALSTTLLSAFNSTFNSTAEFGACTLGFSSRFWLTFENSRSLTVLDFGLIILFKKLWNTLHRYIIGKHPIYMCVRVCVCVCVWERELASTIIYIRAREKDCPVGWSCRIHRLILCSRVRQPEWVS